MVIDTDARYLCAKVEDRSAGGEIVFEFTLVEEVSDGCPFVARKVTVRGYNPHVCLLGRSYRIKLEEIRKVAEAGS